MHKDGARVVDMVDVEHHQSVQVGCLLLAPTSLGTALRLRFLKGCLIDEDRQCPLLGIRLLVVAFRFEFAELSNLILHTVRADDFVEVLLRTSLRGHH